MNVTKDEFLQWKESVVTKSVFEVIDERIEDAKDILATGAGIDPASDRFLVGMISAFNELKGIKFDD